MRRKIDLLGARVIGPSGFREKLIKPNPGGGVGQQTDGVLYHWKDGTLANGAVLESGPSSPPQSAVAEYVNFASTAGSSVTLSGIDAGLGGLIPIKIGNAYGNLTDRVGEILVNGVAAPITFVYTGGFGIWSDLAMVVEMPAGSGNTIALRSTGNDLANVHSLRVYPKLIPDPPAPPPPPAPAPPAPSPTPPPPPPAPAPGAPQMLHVSTATLSGGAVIESTNGTNHVPPGYANFLPSGSKVEWSGVHGGTGGDWAADIHCALGNAGFRDALFKINGTPTTIRFDTTGNWDSYITKRIYGTGALPGAANTLAVESNGQDCANIDWIYFLPNTSAPPVITDEPYEIQAEDMVLSGGVLLETADPGYTGLGALNFPGSGGKATKSGLNGGIAGGSARLDYYCAYDGNSGPTRTGRATMNGAAQDLVTPSTTSWSAYGVVSLYHTMTPGYTNVLDIESIGSDLANIDRIIVYPNTAPPPTPAPPPPPPPAPTPPAPPAPAPAPGVRPIDESDIFAKISIATQGFSVGAKGGAGAEWGANQKTGVAGLSSVVGQGATVSHNLATGPLGPVRVGRKLAPEGDGRYVIAVRGHYNDGETSGAPRTELSWWISQPGSIATKVKRDIWYSFGIYLSEGFPIENECVISQWHTNGYKIGNTTYYAGQPFWAMIIDGDNVVVHNRWNYNQYVSAGTTQARVYTLPGMQMNAWNYFVVKARISPIATDGPYMKMWRATGPSGILTQVIDSANLLGYTGFDGADPPWQKLGHYPWGYDQNNNRWNAPLTRELLYREPIYVDDPTSKYNPVDLLAHVRAR